MTVEFLPGDEPELDAASAARPPTAGASRTARGRRWWLIGALAVSAAVLWTLTRPSLETRPHTPHRAAHSSASSALPVPECRGVPDCSARTGVPVAIARLARKYLPAGAHLHVRTVIKVNSLTYADVLVARDVDVTLDSATVQIQVAVGGPRRQAIVPDPPGVGSLLLHGINSGYVVRLQYLAPETVAPQVSRLHALLSDPRLAAV